MGDGVAGSEAARLVDRPLPVASAPGFAPRRNTGVNVSRDSFTSGPSTVMPIASHSAMKWETFSALPSSAVSTAAMNCTG